MKLARLASRGRLVLPAQKDRPAQLVPLALRATTEQLAQKARAVQLAPLALRVMTEQLVPKARLALLAPRPRWHQLTKLEMSIRPRFLQPMVKPWFGMAKTRNGNLETSNRVAWPRVLRVPLARWALLAPRARRAPLVELA